MEIESERLIGRQPSEADLPDLRLIHGNREAMKTLSADGLPFTEALSLERLTAMVAHFERRGFGAWFFRHRETADFVGYCGLKHSTLDGLEEVELLYGYRPTYWRQGYGSEAAAACVAAAFEAFGLDDLVCITLPHNLGSRGVMERCGFVYEKDIVHAGLPHVLYRLHRADWVARQPSSETNLSA